MPLCLCVWRHAPWTQVADALHPPCVWSTARHAPQLQARREAAVERAQLEEEARLAEVARLRKKEEDAASNQAFAARMVAAGEARAAAAAAQQAVERREACLLYTSPSPRDRTRSRMPSSA